MYTLIIPLKFFKDGAEVENLYSTINRILFYHFAQYLSRYTIIFEKKTAKNFELFFNAYIQAASQKDLVQKAKKFINRLQDILVEQNIKIKISNSEKFLQKITNRIPTQISKKSSFIYEIFSKDYSYYLAVSKLIMKSEANTHGFISLLRDFISVLPIGQFNLDVTNLMELTDEGTKHKANIAITIIIENEEIEKIHQAYKLLNKMMILVNEDNSLLQPISLKFVEEEELQKNFGKIVLNQGWDYFEGSYEGILDFKLFNNLLPNKIDQKRNSHS